MSKKVFIKYTGRVISFQGNEHIVVPVWKERPRIQEDVKTGEQKHIPGIPLVAMSGPFDLETAEAFILARKNNNTTSPSEWLIVPADEVNKHTDVTEKHFYN